MTTQVKQDDIQKIPKLRFSEFSEEWEEKRLVDVFDNSRNKGNSELPIFSVTINNGLVSRDSLGRKIANASNPNDNLYVGRKYLVYNMMRMWQGAVGIAEQECMVSPAYVALKPKSNINSSFFIYYFERDRSLYLFESYSYGLTSDRLRLYYKDFGQIKFFKPTFSEQKKITNFLTSADNWIENLKAQKEKLEKYKKGIMQKIFSQEIRFKDENGKDFGEWEEKKLGEVCEKKSSSISANSLNNNFGGYKIYGASGEFKKVDFYQEEKACISIVKDGAGVGRVLICEPKSSVLGTLDKIKPIKNINLYFLYCFLLQFRFEKYITGSTIPHIYFKDYKKIKINLPSQSEQQKIANFFTSIDNLIEAKNKQIEKSEEWKKGLMQELFV